MASNFHLFQIPDRDSLHIYMQGEFDGTSAHELINTLRNQQRDYYEVLVDTNDLNQIHAFGIDVFQRNLYKRIKNSRNLIFIGKHKHRFAI